MISIGAALRSGIRAWGGLVPWKQRWIFNIFLGIVIELALVAAHDSRLVVASQNWALDLTMRGRAALLESRSQRVPPLTIIDVDEETWRDQRWGSGEPYYAPREELFELIAYALKRQARFVVVDIIAGEHDSPEEKKFAAAVEALAPSLAQAQAHLLFVRTFREPLYAEETLAPEIHPSALDAAVKRHPGQFLVVAPYFQISRDGVMRDWQLWRLGCRREMGREEGHWEIIPSVQLAIATILRAKNNAVPPWSTIALKEPCAVQFNPAYRRSVASQEARIDKSVWRWLSAHQEITRLSDLEEADRGNSELSNRIFYKYASPPQADQVQVVSALKILQSDPHVNSADFRKGVVIIGQSFEAAGDHHATPLGVMPGPLVLANSLDSMLDIGLLQRPNEIWQSLFELLSIVFVGFLFARFDSVVGTLIIAVTFVPALILINYIFLKYGFWLDFAVPLLALFAHRLVKGAEQYLELRTILRREAHEEKREAQS